MLLLNAFILLVVMLVAKWLVGLSIVLLLAALAFAGVIAAIVMETRRRKRGV
jgi:hypothetical protein